MSIVMENTLVQGGDDLLMVVPLKKRELVEEDLDRMRIPKRYWSVRFDQISEAEIKIEDGSKLPVREMIRRYLERADDMRDSGTGLLLWGNNGTGKTSIAVVVAKAFRRRFATVLYMEAADLKRLVIGKEMFDEDETVWERAISVDVLVLDDLGKGTQDSKGFGERLIDELIRTRNSKRLVTIITTNMRLDSELPETLKKSTMETLKEHVLPFEICGDNKRDSVSNQMMSRLLYS